MVQKAVTFVDRLSIDKELDKKLELIDTLRTITEGKVIVITSFSHVSSDSSSRFM
jgi:hypothetical protein